MKDEGGSSTFRLHPSFRATSIILSNRSCIERTLLTRLIDTVPPSSDPEDFVSITQEALAQFLAENFAGPKRALTPAGGRTAFDFGGSLSKPAVAVDLTRLDRVVDYPARDMTITVEAGLRIDRLAEVLRVEGQRLPIDVPQSDRATLGGALATNTSGPRRFGYGTFRDYVIGLTAMTAEGRVFHSGGRVVKNVAGYDLCKLLVGSLGTLAVVTQVTLKLKPLPESSILVAAGFENVADRDAAMGDLLNSQTRPVAIETLNRAAAAAVENQARAGLPDDGWLLLVGFEGSLRETEWQAETWNKELGPRHARQQTRVQGMEADRLWKALTNFAVDSEFAFQANVLPSKVAAFEADIARLGAATLSHSGDGIVIGKLTDPQTGSANWATLWRSVEEAVHRSGGAFVPLCGGASHPVPASANQSRAWALMRKLKQSFDPADLLNPGRMFLE
jgi:glycolate dehydrogenase FAD-binding subunit